MFSSLITYTIQYNMIQCDSIPPYDIKHILINEIIVNLMRVNVNTQGELI